MDRCFSVGFLSVLSESENFFVQNLPSLSPDYILEGYFGGRYKFVCVFIQPESPSLNKIVRRVYFAILTNALGFHSVVFVYDLFLSCFLSRSFAMLPKLGSFAFPFLVCIISVYL